MYGALDKLAVAIGKVKKKPGEPTGSPGYPNDKDYEKRRLNAAVEFLCRNSFD